MTDGTRLMSERERDKGYHLGIEARWTSMLQGGCACYLIKSCKLSKLLDGSLTPVDASARSDKVP